MLGCSSFKHLWDFFRSTSECVNRMTLSSRNLLKLSIIYCLSQILSQDLHIVFLQDSQVQVSKNRRKGVRALRGYFGPHIRPKDEDCFSQVSNHKFIRTIAQV